MADGLALNNILRAICANDVPTLKELPLGCHDLNVPCDDGATVIFSAIFGANPGLVRLLLEHGADPNYLAQGDAPGIYASTPLSLALQLRFIMNWTKYDPMVKLLIEFGATDDDLQSPEREDAVRERALAWQSTKPT